MGLAPGVPCSSPSVGTRTSCSLSSEKTPQTWRRSRSSAIYPSSTVLSFGRRRCMLARRFRLLAQFHEHSHLYPEEAPHRSAGSSAEGHRTRSGDKPSETSSYDGPAHDADEEPPSAQQPDQEAEHDAYGARSHQARSRAPIVPDRRPDHAKHRRAQHHVNGDATVLAPTARHAVHRTHPYCLAIAIRPNSNSTPGPVTREMPHAVEAGS